MLRTGRSGPRGLALRVAVAGGAVLIASAIAAAPALAAVGLPVVSPGNISLPTPPASLPTLPIPTPTGVGSLCVGLATCTSTPARPPATPTPTPALGGSGSSTTGGSATSGTTAAGAGTTTSSAGAVPVAGSGRTEINAIKASTDFSGEIPPPVQSVGQVPGISFGQVPFLWPLFVIFDLVAAAVAVVALRRTWSSSSGTS